ncbi:hypothetical protein MNBD_GAMMA12-651 [hydrothermal vent metagenome]|uniref:2Fe-2S ferredoxin-type domain-containing protein n=1 Tax=hydrothermal vent metagenome TaxID=652676 RepID=A0A3B0YNN2_9ZZZZ
MTQLLTLSKAARLVGVKRNTLQQKIREGELSTFEGLLDINELLRVYPETQVEDNTMLEHVNSIKRKAVAKLVEDHKGPAPGIFVRKLDALQERLFSELENNQTMVKLLKLINRTLQNSESNQDTITSLKPILKNFFSQTPSTTNNNDLHSLLNHLPLEVFINYARLSHSGHEFSLDPNETILEAALRAGLSIPYGCNDGSCGRCKCKVNTGLTRQIRHQSHRLSEDELKQGYILPCAWTSLTDIELDAAIAQTNADIEEQAIKCHIKSVIKQRELLVVTLKTPASQRLRFLAGQTIEISINSRSKSIRLPIASCPCEQGTLQIHINDHYREFCGYFIDPQNQHVPVSIKGPFGNNVLNLNSGNSLIFMASHQHFSHIKGLIEQAMALEISEQIDLFWMTEKNQNSPFENNFRAWADAIDNFHFHPIAIDIDNSEPLMTALTSVESAIEHLPNHDFYCCLDDNELQTLRTFLHGRGVAHAQMHLIPAL